MEYMCPSGHIVLLDDDVELPGKLSIGSHGYAQLTRAEKGTIVLLHRWLMGCMRGDGKMVDHRDRNPLNCRRANLRITTPSGNNQNRARTSGAYPYRGRWQAKVKFRGVQHYLGTYDTREEAVAVVNAWKDEHYDEGP